MFRTNVALRIVTALAVAGATPAIALAQTAAPSVCPTPAVTTNPVPVAVVAPKATLAVRVANTGATREYGLMCVRSLAPHTGMIFVFGDGDLRRSFWMKNTLIPLDMVFVGKGGRVNSVAANVPSTTPATSDLDIPWRYGTGTYVIELAAGEAAQDGIVAGAQLDVSRVGKSKD